MLKWLSILLAYMFLPVSPLHSKVKPEKCGGTYPYHYSKNISHAEAEARAVENAVIMALAEKFGTTVTSQSMMELSTQGSGYSQATRLLVKGKLLKHIHEPKISAPLYADNMFRIDVTVAFEAVPIEYAPTEFEAKVLRNGQEDKFESNTFADGDKFYLSFMSPKAGYAAVFYEDAAQVSCMLPYIDEEEARQVEKGEKYVFFNTPNNTYHLVCGEESEINYVHVLFSDSKFINGDLLRNMKPAKFRDWMGVRQSYDNGLQIQSFMIKVNPKNP